MKLNETSQDIKMTQEDHKKPNFKKWMKMTTKMACLLR